MHIRVFLIVGFVLSLAGCTQTQIDMAANSACAIASMEANQYAGSDNPKIHVAVVATNAVCADPTATVAQVNAARVALKNAIK
jgi:hypothetical protein